MYDKFVYIDYLQGLWREKIKIELQVQKVLQLKTMVQNYSIKHPKDSYFIDISQRLAVYCFRLLLECANQKAPYVRGTYLNWKKASKYWTLYLKIHIAKSPKRSDGMIQFDTFLQKVELEQLQYRTYIQYDTNPDDYSKIVNFKKIVLLVNDWNCSVDGA